MALLQCRHGLLDPKGSLLSALLAQAVAQVIQEAQEAMNTRDPFRNPPFSQRV